jgi:general stress protein 26
MAAKTNEDFWDDLEDFDACMMVTRDGDLLRSRPMKPYFDAGDGTIRFLTSREAHKIEEVERNPQTNLVFADEDDGMWISVSGTVSTTNDRSAVDDLWDTDAEAWLDKEEAAVLIVRPSLAEYWESDGTLKSTWEMMKGLATGAKPDMGENRKLRL